MLVSTIGAIYAVILVFVFYLLDRHSTKKHRRP